MKELTPERFLTEEPHPREERQDSLSCQFVDSGELNTVELRRLGKLLERHSIYAVEFEMTDPVEWAMQAQAYYDGNQKQLGEHPHTIVVVENADRILKQTIRRRDRHLGFVVRSDYNPAAIYLDRE